MPAAPVLSSLVPHDIGDMADVGMGIADYGAWIAAGVAMLLLAALARWSMTPTRRIPPVEDPADRGQPVPGPRPDDEQTAAHVRLAPTPRDVHARGRSGRRNRHDQLRRRTSSSHRPGPRR